jgi:hypothetical protein
MGSGGIMLTVTFVIQNPKTYNLFSGWGMIILLFLLGNYLMIRSFRRVWADLLIKRHVKTVDNFIETSLKNGDPWMVKFVMSFPRERFTNITIQDIFYNCIWSYEKMIKDYSVWKLDKMVSNRELFDRIYKKDSK